MFKIPFNGNSKVIDFLQVPKFTKVARLSKRLYCKGPPLHPRLNNTKDALYCTSGWVKESFLLVLDQ